MGAVSGLSKGRLRELSQAAGDLSEVAGQVLPGKTQPQPFAMTEAQRLFDELERTRGPLAKGALLEAAVARLEPDEARYVIKILTGELRIGLKEGLLEEALAVAFEQSSDEIREANMLLGQPRPRRAARPRGQPARRRADVLPAHQEHARQPRADRRVHLEAPRGTPRRRADRRAGGAGNAPLDARAAAQTPPSKPGVVWVEDKFDGVRAQLHRADRTAGWRFIRATCGRSRGSSRKSPRPSPAGCATR